MFRTIETSIWHDPKFRALPAPAKLMFIYLITNPHAHVSGIYYLPDVTILHEAGLKGEAVNTLWNTLSGAGLCFRDQELEVVWVKNMLAHQGRGDKNARSAAHQLKTLHKSNLIQEYLSHYPQVKRHFRDRVSDRVTRPCPQEQDKEKDLESGSGVNAATRDEGSEPSPTPANGSGKVSRNGRRRSEQTGDHADLIRHFAAGWKARYGADYPLKRGKDHTHFSWILEKSKGDLAKARQAVDAFLRDDDPKVVQKKHPVGWLVSGFQQYLPTPGGNGVAPLTAARIYDI